MNSKLTESLIIRKLLANRECSIATSYNGFTDNAIISYYNDGLKLYFGSFDDTLKSRNIEKNELVAITVGSVQIHGIATKLNRNSLEYVMNIDKYLKKFPNYNYFFEYKSNNLYKIDALICWNYNYKKGMMYRDKLILDYDYYQKIKPYEAPQKYEKYGEEL